MEVTAPIFTVCGTPTYVAPEILEESGYGLKVDMWAAGVITYIMLCGFPPFRSARRDQDELFDLIQEGIFEFLSPYWDPVSSEAKDLISHLLVVSVKERYSAEQVLAHPWIRQRSPTADELKKKFLNEGKNAQTKARKKFKAAALAVQGAKKFENLAEQFRHQRGEKVILTWRSTWLTLHSVAEFLHDTLHDGVLRNHSNTNSGWAVRACTYPLLG